MIAWFQEEQAAVPPAPAKLCKKCQLALLEAAHVLFLEDSEVPPELAGKERSVNWSINSTNKSVSIGYPGHTTYTYSWDLLGFTGCGEA